MNPDSYTNGGYHGFSVGESCGGHDDSGWARGGLGRRTPGGFATTVEMSSPRSRAWKQAAFLLRLRPFADAAERLAAEIALAEFLLDGE